MNLNLIVVFFLIRGSLISTINLIANPLLHKLCLIGSDSDLENIKIKDLEIKYVSSPYSSSVEICDVVVYFNQESPNDNCPGKCVPVPSQNITRADINNFLNREWNNITCSLYENTISEHLKSLNKMDRLSLLFEAIYYRRILECREKVLWPDNIPHIYRKRQRIDGLYIWVGSTKDSELLQLQRSVLRHNQSRDWDYRNVGWLATEDSYSCHINSTFCPYPLRNQQYNKHLPRTGNQTYYSN